jgi:hypothetical protein
MKSIQERYGHIESPRGNVRHSYSENEAIYQNEVEFETFVQQFPIDDSIAECFAAAKDNVTSKQDTKFVSVRSFFICREVLLHFKLLVLESFRN